ncbi:hypothetical protein DID73_01625 [Candidatus Marinamargulisbacteria bacterium SCGC AG-343-K17]|nr:hypothetical protein DID73_01625 [Candidatus Marinamargulisbacteria bacterium SCGC AG-343-K17]
MGLLTKSKYIQALQCKKLLWLTLNQPSALSINDNKQAVYDQGTMVGIDAQSLFPSGIMVDSDLSFPEKISTTRDYISKSQSMFEGAFKWDQCFCMVDVLVFNDGAWDLIEVKSSTSVKPIHYHDVGFQTFVLTQLGIEIRDMFICHIDTSYKRQGMLDRTALFHCDKVTNDVLDLLPTIKKNIHEFLPILKSANSDIPIGPHCFSPYECSAMDHCWKGVPDDSIFEITEMSIQHKFSLYYKNQFLISELDPNSFSRFKQKQQIACHLEGLDFINTEKLTTYLSQIHAPFSFLDFECFQTAIPPFDGLHPYDQIPFQFSLHIDNEKELLHHGYIAPYGEDPRPLILDELKKHIPSSGSILVFNRQYEALILNQLKTRFPSEAPFIDGVLERLIDLEIPFKNNYIYLRQMKGKTSIKSVLPALCPTFSYDQLTISSGRSINSMYQKLSDDNDKDDAYQFLFEYGRLDTYAMVMILKRLMFLLGV